MVRHRFESEVVDAGDPDEVGPDEWNDEHVGGVVAGADYFRVDSEMFNFTGPWAGGVITSTVNGSGSTISNGTPVVGHPGVVTLQTGTTSSGRAALASPASENVQLGTGGGVLRAGVVLRIPNTSALSDGTNTYSVQFGFAPATGGVGSGTNTMGFRYSSDASSGNWEVRLGAATGNPVIDTGVAVVLGTWYKLEIEVDEDATEVLFYINGALEHTETTDIPTTQPIQFLAGGIFKSASTTNRFINLDAFWFEQVLTTPR